MKRGVMLINVSRGRLVDTTALIAGLKRGHIGGVALDVYEEEEGVFFEDLSGEVLQDDELARLLSFPNVLITSHQAFLPRRPCAKSPASRSRIYDALPLVSPSSKELRCDVWLDPDQRFRIVEVLTKILR
jgi:D-lactate dehydrogenase